MSFNKTKTDPELGRQVHEHLVSVGVETPTKPNSLDRKEKIEKMLVAIYYSSKKENQKIHKNIRLLKPCLVYKNDKN